MHKKIASKIQAISTPGQPTARRVDEHANGEVQAALVPLIIIEPNPLLREGVGKLLGGSRYEVIGSSSAFEGLAAPPSRLPELVLIGGDEVHATIRILEDCKQAYPLARRVVFSDIHGEDLSQVLQCGAHACLGRDVTIQTLVMTLDLAMLGANIICGPLPQVGSGSGVPLSRSPAPDEIHSKLELSEVAHRLSSREIAILECLMHGDSNKLIARKFQIAESTVKVHIKAILRKLRAANRTQAAIWAMTHLARSNSGPTKELSAATG